MALTYMPLTLHWLLHFILRCASRVFFPVLALTASLASPPSISAQLGAALPLVLPSAGILSAPANPAPDPEDPGGHTSARGSSSGVALEGVPPSLLLPDLRTLPPTDLKIKILPGGKRQLRLSNTIWNGGDGPLELSGDYLPDLRQTLVTQRVYTAGDEVQERRIGEFVYHPTHNHWHFAGFTLYELWSLRPDTTPHRVVSSSDKLSYCVIDTDKTDPRHPGFVSHKRYHSCGQKYQGLSIGWGDTYESHLDGQSLELDGVPDGFYLLRSTANPDQALLEDTYANNATGIYLQIRGAHLNITTPAEIIDDLCTSNGWC